MQGAEIAPQSGLTIAKGALVELRQRDQEFAAELLVELKRLLHLWHALGVAPLDAVLRAALTAHGEQVKRRSRPV